MSWGEASSLSNLSLSTKLISPANHDGTLDSVELRYRVNGPVHLEFTVLDKDHAIVRTYWKDRIGAADDLADRDRGGQERPELLRS